MKRRMLSYVVQNVGSWNGCERICTGMLGNLLHMI